MSLSIKQKRFIARLDSETKQILRYGGDEETLLMSLCDEDKMNAIKEIIDSSPENVGELNAYCEQYDGFYQYMNLLERLALGISRGVFDDILK